MIGDPAKGRLARRGAAAALWCALVMVGPHWLGLTWGSAALPSRLAGVGAALALGFPSLRARRADHGKGPLSAEAPRSSAWRSAALRALFGAALFAPFALAIDSLSVAGAAQVPHVLGLACLCGLAAAFGGSRASASAAYGGVAALVILALAFGSWGTGAAGSDGGRRGAPLAAGSLRAVELELRGPLAQESLQIEGFPALEVRAALLPGEVRSAQAWVVGPRSTLDWPRIIEGESLTAKLLGDGYHCPDWAQRTGPPGAVVGGGERFPGATALLAAFAAAIASIAVLRSQLRPWAVQALAFVVVGSLGSLGARYLAQTAAALPLGAGDPLQVAVLEGRRLADGGTEWVEFRRSFGEVVLPVSAFGRASSGRFEVADPRGPKGTALELTGTDPVWRLVAPGPSVALDWRGPFDAGMRILVPEVNTWGAFSAAWERDSGGEWTPFGALGLGEGPVAVSVGEDPPGWCGQELPQGGALGASLFLGRLEKPLQGTSATWIRLSGFRSE